MSGEKLIFLYVSQEKETNEKLRIQLKQLGVRNEMVTRDFEESKNKLEIEAAKNMSSSVDQKGTFFTRYWFFSQ